MRLLLLRHGQTHGNTIGALDTGFPGADLTDLGIRQAEAAARVLGGSGVQSIYVSNLVRTQQTAAPLATALGITPVLLADLREISAGDYEMATDEASILGYVGTVADWIEGRTTTRMAGAESGTEFLERYDGAVSQIAAAGDPVALLVSHGAAIRTWVANRVTDAGAHEMASESFHNTACIEIEGDPSSGWHVLSWTPDPVGGAYLDDLTAPDPTGQSTEDA